MFYSYIQLHQLNFRRLIPLCIERSSRWAVFDLGPIRNAHSGCLIVSSCQIKRLTEVDLNFKHIILLHGRHPLVVLFLRHMHLKHLKEGFDYLRTLIKQTFAVLKLRATLRFSRFSCVL